MTFKLTDTQRRNLIDALNDAIDWEASLADTNHGNNAEVMRVDAGQRAVVRDCEKKIAAFRKLLAKLEANTRTPSERLTDGMTPVSLADIKVSRG